MLCPYVKWTQHLFPLPDRTWSSLRTELHVTALSMPIAGTWRTSRPPGAHIGISGTRRVRAPPQWPEDAKTTKDVVPDLQSHLEAVNLLWPGTQVVN